MKVEAKLHYGIFKKRGEVEIYIFVEQALSLRPADLCKTNNCHDR